VTAARSVLAELVFQRVDDAIDFNALLLFEDDLADAITDAQDQGDAGLDAAALMDAAWARAEARWREMRAMERGGGDDHDECALCANPPPGMHFELDLDDPKAGFRPIDPRTHRHRG